MVVFRRIYFLNLLVVIQFPSTQQHSSKDYCKMSCGQDHIACKYKDEGYGKSCKNPISIVDLKPYKEEILRLHNKKRDSVASGAEKKYPSASRMGEMAWDDELAYLARIKVRQCKLVDDDCRNTDRFNNTGRNSNVMRWWHERTYTDEQILVQRIQEWMDTSEAADGQIVYSYPKTTPPDHAKFFANAVIESNNRIGCAAIRFTDWKKRKNFLINCYYARNVAPDMILYRTGKAASACKSKASTKFRSLCSINEIYDYTGRDDPQPLKAKPVSISPKAPQGKGKKGKGKVGKRGKGYSSDSGSYGI